MRDYPYDGIDPADCPVCTGAVTGWWKTDEHLCLECEYHRAMDDTWLAIAAEDELADQRAMNA